MYCQECEFYRHGCCGKTGEDKEPEDYCGSFKRRYR